MIPPAQSQAQARISVSCPGFSCPLEPRSATYGAAKIGTESMSAFLASLPTVFSVPLGCVSITQPALVLETSSSQALLFDLLWLIQDPDALRIAQQTLQISPFPFRITHSSDLLLAGVWPLGSPRLPPVTWISPVIFCYWFFLSWRKSCVLSVYYVPGIVIGALN